jgi:hypothetical protein
VIFIEQEIDGLREELVAILRGLLRELGQGLRLPLAQLGARDIDLRLIVQQEFLTLESVTLNAQATDGSLPQRRQRVNPRESEDCIC